MGEREGVIVNRDERISCMTAWAHWKRIELDRTKAKGFTGSDRPILFDIYENELLFLESIEMMLAEIKRLETENANRATWQCIKCGCQYSNDVAVKALDDIANGDDSTAHTIAREALAAIETENYKAGKNTRMQELE